MPLNPGARLGHYDVTSLLGEGGIGQVWQATAGPPGFLIRTSERAALTVSITPGAGTTTTRTPWP